MKILHYSDKADPNFLKLYQECDILVVTGDLTLFDFAGMDEEIVKRPAFGVYGNHDSGRYFEGLGIENLHNRVVRLEGYSWGGFQGCLKYKESDLMYTEEEARKFADNFPYVDFLLLHAGGRDLLDDPKDTVHKGSESIRGYILDKKPKYVFCGHQYSNAEMDLNETKIFRTYGARIIEI